MNSIPQWKKIYQTVSGYSQTITPDIVEEILNLSQNEIIQGLLHYKPYTKKSYDDWQQTKKVSSSVQEFIKDLSLDLNLDAKTTYLIMRNYLMSEYYGKIKEFWHVLRHGTASRLKENIWNYYTAERMFMLKTLRHIFECLGDKNHKFYIEYNNFIKSIKITTLQDNLINQFQALVKENDLNEITDQSRLKNFLCKNHREQIEILLIITLTSDHNKLSKTQFFQLVKLFVNRRFNIQPNIRNMELCNQDNLNDLMCAQIGCYFAIIKNQELSDLLAFWNEEKTNILEINSISGKVEQTMVLIAWLLLKIKMSGTEIDEKSELVIDVLLNKKPFVLLVSVLRSEIFKKCRCGDIVLKSVFEVVDILCLMFADHKLLYCEEELISALVEFIKHPNLSEICLQNRGSIDTIYNLAIETFPYDFFSFTKIFAELLGQKSQYKLAFNILNNMPTFLSDMTWTIPKEEISILHQHQQALPNSDLIIFPPKTLVKSFRIFDKNLIQYKTKYRYFSYIEYLLNLILNDCVQHHKIDNSLVEKIEAGFQLIIQAIKHCNHDDFRQLQLDNCFKKLDGILCNFSTQYFNKNLLKLYFNVNDALMVYQDKCFLKTCPEIFKKSLFLTVKYDFFKTKFISLIYDQNIFDRTVLFKLLKDEENTGDHSLLLSYMNILYNFTKSNAVDEYFETVGVSYLLSFVFFQHKSWEYKNENQCAKVTLQCINIFHYILQQNDQELKIYKICQEAFLHNDVIINAFVRLFIKKRYHVFHIMERESNWINGSSLDNLHCIRIQLAVLLLIMNMKKKLQSKCTFDYTLKMIVKPIASYFINAYNPTIAELSCRFLAKLSEDSSVPLLAWLELDHYQVQALFLDKLRDPLEEDYVKIAIIDLINTCVINQNGMTAAFFNLKCFMYWDGMEEELDVGDTVSDFMVDYLQNLKQSHEYLKNPLQLGILKLFYNLWSSHRKHLIQNIIGIKDFWSIMVDPLFHSFIQDTEVYTVILKIINIEITTNINNVDKNLLEVIKKFITNKEPLKVCLSYMLKSSKLHKLEDVDLVNALMEFIIVTKKVIPNSFDNELKLFIITTCLEALSIPDISQNTEIIYVWAQLYLMLINTWSVYENKEGIIVGKLGKIFNSSVAMYSYLPLKIREIFLIIINKTLIDLKNYFENNSTVLTNFLYPIGQFVDKEYEILENNCWSSIKDDIERINLLKPWLITIFIANSLLDLKNIEEHALWFYYRQFLERVMLSIEIMLKNKSTLSLAKIAINHMILYAKSGLVKHFLKVDLYKFYFNLKSPSLVIGVGEAILSGLPTELKEWWLIYTMVMKLNQLLIINLGLQAKNFCFSFMAQHDQTVQDIISLTRHTVDMTALTVVCETFRFISIFFNNWRKEWFCNAERSYELLIESIKITINACILSVLGSKKINFYSILNEKLDVIETAPVNLLSSVMNKLIEIFFWGFSCLKKTKTPLYTLFNPELSQDDIRFFIQNDFSVPRFELPITSDLTYGRILCFAHYLCKILNQLPPKDNKETESDLFKLDKKMQTYDKISEYYSAPYKNTTGFMIYLQKTDDMPSEQWSSFLHYDMSEHSASATSVIQLLNYNIIRNSLEILMTFLAGEVYLAIKTVDDDVIYHFKRELCSEIQFFYEFVRKQTHEQYNTMLASPRTIVNIQHETDIIKRYVLVNMKHDPNFIVENNFSLVISEWLTKICQLSN